MQTEFNNKFKLNSFDIERIDKKHIFHLFRAIMHYEIVKFYASDVDDISVRQKDDNISAFQN